MKFTINTKVFFKSISKVSRAISNKTTIPILTGMKMTANDDGLELVGSDADISIRYTVKPDKDSQLSVAEKGAIVVPAKFFSQVIKSMPDQVVTVEVGSDFQMKVTSGKSHFKINCLDADNYPHLPQVKSGQTIGLSGDLLQEVIKEITINASTQESRPLLTGVHFTIKDGQFTAVATDSHRLGVRKLAINNSADFDLNVPASSLQTLSRLISKHADVYMSYSENQVQFNLGRTVFYSRLLTGNYPDTSQLIPNDASTTLTMHASDLLPIIDRASLISHASRNNVLDLQLKPNKQELTLISNSPDVGKTQETAKPKLDGKDLNISFNPDYMKDALKTLGDTVVDISFTSPLRPFVITPSNQKSHAYTQLITPVRTF